jgi:hypothetical protein
MKGPCGRFPFSPQSAIAIAGEAIRRSPNLSGFLYCPAEICAVTRQKFFSLLLKKLLLSSVVMIHMILMAVAYDVRYQQRVQKRLTRLRKRLLAFVIKANPECFDHGGRLAPGCFPARIPREAADLHGLMRRAECKLAMIRCHAECDIAKS